MKIRSTSGYLGVLLLIGTLTAAEAAGPLTQVGSWFSLGSSAHDLVIEGNLAYVVTDLGLKIVNLSNPAAPVVVGSINNLGGKGFGVALKLPYLYVANQIKDLQIIDVSDPADPALVATKTLPGYSWDVAVKDDRATGGKLVAYVASFSGELYVIDVTNPTSPQQVKVLGLPAWSSSSADATNLAKLNNHVTSGGAKVTGVAVAGNNLFSVDWNYGRIYYHDVTQAHNPVFAGTHYAPFILRVDGDPAGQVAYGLSAFGHTSGIYSVTLSTLDRSYSTRHTTCTECDYFPSPQTDYGGLAVSANSNYVMHIGGKSGVVQVVDVRDPTDMQIAGSVSIPAHGAKTAQSMGVAQYGDYIIAAAANLGLGVFHFPGLGLPD